MIFTDEYFMQLALQQAAIAFDEGEIPVGAIITCRDTIIAKAYNQTEKLNDVTAHAEMLAITSAAQYLGTKYLKDCTLYVTLEPCTMCGGGIFWSQLGRLVIGASDEKRGFLRLKPSIIHPKTLVETGILQEESEELLHRFFAKLRT